MSPSWLDLPDDELGLGLRDLGTHLDVGGADLVDAVLTRLDADAEPTASRFDPRRLLQLAAAILVVTVLGLVALTPSREAIADWLGIGGVRITRTDRPPPTGRSSGTTTAPQPEIDEATADLPFTVRRADPDRAGPPRSVIVDTRFPAGLVEIRYRDFTLVELASAPGEPPSMDKFVTGGTAVREVRVGGHDGLWISGEPHEIGFIDVDGRLDADSVRRVGNVLVWEDRGVTYRIEGLETLEAALAQADGLH